MSGSAGLSPSRNRKPEGSTLSGYARNLRKECAGLVAGQAVLTAELMTARVPFAMFLLSLPPGGRPLSNLIATVETELQVCRPYVPCEPLPACQELRAAPGN